MNESGAQAAGEKPPLGVRAAWLLLLAAAAAAAFVFLRRVFSWSNCWRWSITEGREGPSIYAIWRVVHDRPLYQWPDREPYGLTFFNFGFYHAYAAISKLFHADAETLLAVPRAFTVLGSAVGLMLFVATAAFLARPRARLEWCSLGALAIVVWFGTQFIAWWVLAIRPDIWASVFVLAGLRVALPGLAENRPSKLVLASLLFWLAWTFKQSCVWTLTGCALSALLVVRNVRAVAALAVPFALLAAVSFALGGDVYRFNLLTVPAASAWHAHLMLEVLSRAVPQNVWVFGFFPLAFALTRLGPNRPAWRTLPVADRTLALVVLVTVVMGTFALGREGSNKNHLFEGYIASALASWTVLHRLAWNAERPKRLLELGLVALVPLVAFPLLQIAAPNGAGRTILCSRDDAAEFAKLANAIARLPKPYYTDDEIFSQPWQATGNQYPAIVIDGSFTAIARREGLVAQDFPSKLFVFPRYRSVVQLAIHPDVPALNARGIKCTTLPGRPFGLEYVVCPLTPSSP